MFKVLFGVALGLLVLYFWDAVWWALQFAGIYILVLGPLLAPVIYFGYRDSHRH